MGTWAGLGVAPEESGRPEPIMRSVAGQGRPDSSGDRTPRP